MRDSSPLKLKADAILRATTTAEVADILKLANREAALVTPPRQVVRYLKYDVGYYFLALSG